MTKIIICLIVLFSIFATSLINTKASLYIDQIENYEITIDTNRDGTLKMEFYVRWKVINDTIEGPLEWIKIGIPNKFVSNIKGLTSNIYDIYYYSDLGSYIRIDLDRPYKAGEVLDIRFSLIQSRMYFLDGSKCHYNYKPGWFDEIYVAKAVVKWNADGIINANCKNIIDGYYVYETALNPKQTINVNMTYENDYFRVLNPDLQYSDAYMTFKDYLAIGIVIAVFVAAIVVVIISVIKQYDPYMNERGFVGRGYYYNTHRYRGRGYYSSGSRISNPNVSSSSGFRGGGGSSCACACACAGGGRAGCSMKDFYKHPNLEQIKKALD